MKKLLIFVLLFFTATVHAADEAAVLDEQTVKVCNKTLMNIYDNIIAVKDKYPELQAFGPNNLSQNHFGLYVLSFENKDCQTLRGDDYYRFGLTIVPTTENPYKEPNAQIIALGY